MAGRGEYEPKDSRNVTGTAATEDGRWTNREGTPPLAGGEHPAPRDYEEEEEEGGEDREIVAFEPAPELKRMIEEGRAVRRVGAAKPTRH
jgi:hypothetical protein